ncbi:carboxypeptidase-like regulatory domain-containing protein [Parabacteroides sp. AF48-14]|uniref:carboxypeptidase-like regulatory domain-containing protein n=1 Tax=Parabacteroides sp. AF48-14 TaxID=2292052 RepID=UPI0026CAB6A9
MKKWTTESPSNYLAIRRYAYLLIIFLCIINIGGVSAQNLPITGKVVDMSGEPLIGVNVLQKGTTNGSITDINGEYSISVSGKNVVLVFSYIGYLHRKFRQVSKTRLM